MPPTDADGSVTGWIDLLRDGDPAAAQPLWERYFARLVGLARARLRAARAPGAAADAEDVALSAFESFWDGAGRGRFPRLRDRDDLWRLLVVITARKAANQARDQRRQKRGGGRVLDEAALLDADADGGLERFVGREPSPEFAATLAEEFRARLEALGDDTLRKIAVWKMEGHTSEEIAARLNCAVRTVANKLTLIRLKWEKDP